MRKSMVGVLIGLLLAALLGAPVSGLAAPAKKASPAQKPVAVTKHRAWTPGEEIEIAFPQPVYLGGDETTATVTISGRTDGATVIATVTGPNLDTTVDVTAGTGLVPVTVPTTPNSYTYTATATINGQLYSDDFVLTVSSNRRPMVTNGTATTDEDTAVQLTIPQNFSAADPDNDPLTYTPSFPLTYTPPEDFVGDIEVPITVSDGNGGDVTGYITVTVTAVNDAPVAYEGAASTEEDTAVTIALQGTDVDGDDLTASIVAGPTHGTLGTIDPDTLEVTYTPTADYAGSDSFTFKVNDGTVDSETVTIFITVNPVGDAVTLTVDPYLLANGTDQGTVSVLVKDAQGNPLPDAEVTLATTAGTLGMTTVTTGQDGTASTTLTAAAIPADGVQVTATYGDDTDMKTVAFFTFTLTPSEGTAIPDTTPPLYATKVGTTGTTVTFTVTTTPDIPLENLVTWSANVSGTEPATRTLAKDDGLDATVTATMRGLTQSVRLAVLEVTAITVDSGTASLITNDPLDPGKTHAVAQYDATPDANVVFKATVSPDIAAVRPYYNALLVWTGGQTNTAAEKRNLPLGAPRGEAWSVTCGASKVEMTAWVVRVNIDIAGVADADEDTVKAVIRQNNDDDDGSAASDLSESPVSGEDDLVPTSVTVEPQSIGGVVTLTLSSGNIKVYRHADKSGTLPANLTWTYSTHLNANPGDDETAPTLLWVEGYAASLAETLTLTHTWGLTSSDAVQAEVQEGATTGVNLFVVTGVTTPQGIMPGTEKYDPIGGKVYVAVLVKVGPNQRLDPAMNTLTVEAKDVGYAYTDGMPAATQATVDLTAATGWWELINPWTPQAYWALATDAPKTANTTAGTRFYCRLIEWNTPITPSLAFTPPMGHNGAHLVRVTKVNAVETKVVAFQKQDGATWVADPLATLPVPDKRAVVKNLVITNVRTSNGTEDYFKYDPDPEAPALLHRPVITFTIEDDGDPHEYDAYIFMWPTSRTGDLFTRMTTSDAMAWMTRWHLTPGPQSVEWDGARVDQAWAGHAADDSPWSTYAFEIYVYEYADGSARVGEELDWGGVRWPYCLAIGPHDMWIDEGEECCDLRFQYMLEDKNSRDAKSLTIEAIDENLESHDIQAVIQDKLVVGTPPILHDGENAAGILALKRSAFVGYRIVYTGEDSCWMGYRRDHEPSRILAANSRSQIKLGTREWINVRRAILATYLAFGHTPSGILHSHDGANTFKRGVDETFYGNVNVGGKQSPKWIKLHWENTIKRMAISINYYRRKLFYDENYQGFCRLPNNREQMDWPSRNRFDPSEFDDLSTLRFLLFGKSIDVISKPTATVDDISNLAKTFVHEMIHVSTAEALENEYVKKFGSSEEPDPKGGFMKISYWEKMVDRYAEHLVNGNAIDDIVKWNFEKQDEPFINSALRWNDLALQVRSGNPSWVANGSTPYGGALRLQSSDSLTTPGTPPTSINGVTRQGFPFEIKFKIKIDEATFEPGANKRILSVGASDVIMYIKCNDTWSHSKITVKSGNQDIISIPVPQFDQWALIKYSYNGNGEHIATCNNGTPFKGVKNISTGAITGSGVTIGSSGGGGFTGLLDQISIGCPYRYLFLEADYSAFTLPQ